MLRSVVVNVLVGLVDGIGGMECRKNCGVGVVVLSVAWSV